MIQKIRGTQDFLTMILFNYCIQTIGKHLECYNFTEISTPILEPIELFKRSLGLHTDVVSKEMFVIASHDETESMCLRPEATASTMRAFLEHRNEIQTPWKVFSFGPMFRYERPQKGRFRQFHQLSLEIIDAESIAYDASLLTMLDRLFQVVFGLENFALMINFLGCPHDRVQYKKILYAFLTEHEGHICATCKERKEKNILRVFDCKTETCQALYRTAPYIVQHLCVPCAKEWDQLKAYLEMQSVSYTYLPTLVRGLDYYNKTVFEFVSSQLGAQSAFCGGGRYSLATVLGSQQEYASLGAAIGIERLMLLLEPYMSTLALPQKPSLTMIIPMAQEQYALALLVADELHAGGLCTDILFEGSLKSMMRKAQKFGAHHVVIIGEEEQATGTVTVKNMMTGEQEKIAQIKLVSYLKK